MAHIQKVNVTSFRNMQNCNVSLSGGLNLLYGGNASGKTAFLHAIITAWNYENKPSPLGDVETIPCGSWDYHYYSDRRSQYRIEGVQIPLTGEMPPKMESNRILWFIVSVLKQQARRANPRYAANAKDREWLARLNDFWTCFRGNGTTLDVDLVNPNDGSLDWNLFVFKGDQRLYDVNELSGGESDAIAFVVPFIMEQRPYDGVVLIDDVEAYMTQEWATSLLTALRTMLPEAQFIVTTRLKGWTLPDCTVYDMAAITGKA